MRRTLLLGMCASVSGMSAPGASFEEPVYTPTIPFITSTATAPIQPKLAALPLHTVKLKGETRFTEAMDVNTKYLLYLEPDRLLYQFRTVANLSTEGTCSTSFLS
jgi:hypothetical protein